jgi:alkyl hydroperoxide reductase subunit D
MSLEALKNRLPEYAKDLKLNLSSLAMEPTLSEQQRAGTFIACALASRNAETTRAILGEFAPKLSPEALDAARAAASIMAMNNIYYRFVHLASATDYAGMPARLRMNVIANPGVDGLDFELWSLAVSAINGCGMCIDSHEREIVKKGASREAVQNIVRIAAVIHAVAVTLESEAPTA